MPHNDNERPFQGRYRKSQSKATWHNVVFGPSAEYAAKIDPAALVFVEGSLSTRTYEREIDTPNGPVTSSI